MPNRKVHTGGMKRPASTTNLAVTEGAPSSSGLSAQEPAAQRRRLGGSGGGVGGSAQNFDDERSMLMFISSAQSAMMRGAQMRPMDYARAGISPMAATSLSATTRQRAARDAASVSPVMSTSAVVSSHNLHSSPIESSPTTVLATRVSGRGSAASALAESAASARSTMAAVVGSQFSADRSITPGAPPSFVSASAALVQRAGGGGAPLFDYRSGVGGAVWNVRARAGASSALVTPLVTAMADNNNSDSNRARADNFNAFDLFAVAPYGTFSQSVANRRLLSEMKQLEESPLAGCQASPREESILQWTAAIDGPADTVYEGGTFFVELAFTENYPFEAPKIVFLTRIYHCNINSQGKVCMDPISRGWTSCMTISTVLQSLISLLYACNPKDALVPYIAEQFMKSPEEYDKMARIWTQRYAQ